MLDFPILCKYELSGRWAHLICNIKLDCFLVSFCNWFQIFVNGKAPPSCSTFVFLGEAFHVSAHLAFSLVLYACFMVEALNRREFLSMSGRLIMALDQPAAALLASLSTSLLPFTLLCPDIHLMLRLDLSEFAAVVRLLIRYCPVFMRFDVRGAIIDWLSVYSDTFFPIVSGVFCSVHVASIAPNISALYVLCLSGVLM